ncbi:Ig-like domain-containing protein [Neobacillus drentensis]|uniref:Ig-like domain-containing protein n=1 Tax=Neobacillus drentensis TaxID=220684 RepID=UPI0030024A36
MVYPKQSYKSAMSILLVALLVLSSLFQPRGLVAKAEEPNTPLTGVLRSDKTLTKENGPYTIDKNFDVAPGVVLTIEEGVMISGKDSYLSTMNVYGELRVNGTKDEPVRFSKLLINNETATDGPIHTIVSHASFESSRLFQTAGRVGQAMLSISDSYFDHSEIHHNGGDDNNSSLLTFTRNHLVHSSVDSDAKWNVSDNTAYFGSFRDNYGNNDVDFVRNHGLIFLNIGAAVYAVEPPWRVDRHVLIDGNDFLGSSGIKLGGELTKAKASIMISNNTFRNRGQQGLFNSYLNTVIESYFFVRSPENIPNAEVNIEHNTFLVDGNTKSISLRLSGGGLMYKPFYGERGLQHHIQHNDFLGNNVTEIYNETVGIVDATNNYWGTSDREKIDGSVYDDDDLYGAGDVNVDSFSEEAFHIVQPSEPPSQPVVKPFSNIDRVLSGTVANDDVYRIIVKQNEQDDFSSEVTTKKAPVNEDGTFNVELLSEYATKYEAGTSFYVQAEDVYGNLTTPQKVTVIDMIPPSFWIPLEKFADNETVINGSIDKKATIIVYANNKEITKTDILAAGSFSVTIPSQKEGTVLTAKVYNENGVKADLEWTVTVVDGTPPPRPRLNEVTTLSDAVTGSTEPQAKIRVWKDFFYLGETTASADGSFSIPLNGVRLFEDDEISVEATDQIGNHSELGSTHVVLEFLPYVYFNEISDMSTEIRGYAVPNAHLNIMNSKNELLFEATVSDEGMFSFQVANLLAGEKLTAIVTDSKQRTATDSTVVVDKTPPKVSGVENNELINHDVRITFNEGTATLNDDAFESGSWVSKEGSYTLRINDAAGNATTATFTIDKTPPKISGVVNNTLMNRDAKVTFNEGTATLNGKPIINGSLVRTDGTYTLSVTDKAGNVAIVKFTIDKTAPSNFTVNLVSDKSKEVTGKIEAGATVSILIGTKIYAAKADANGNFKVIIPAQKAGSKLTVTAKDAAGNVSAAKSIIVLDKTAPVTPSVTTISDQAKVVTGKAEAGAIVTVTIGTKKYIAKADSKGNFKVMIPIQKAGTKVTVTAKDTAGNVSVAKSVIVIDKTAPLVPKIKTLVKSTTKEVTGTAEAYTTITIKVGSKVIGTAKVDSKGNFKVKIKAQKKNTVLSVTATDKAKNVSKAATVKVK